MSQENWINYLRGNICTSFKRMRKERGWFILEEPIREVVVEDRLGQRGSKFSTMHNLWRRGASFYGLARIGDRSHFPSVLSGCISNAERLARLHEYGSMDTMDITNIQYITEIKKSYETLMVNYIDFDRATTTTMTTAIELCLKSICAHVNLKINGEAKFPVTHSIKDLYHELPNDFRREFISESALYKKQYAEYIKVLRKIMDNFGKREAPLDRAKEMRQMIAYQEKINYTLFHYDNDPAEVRCPPEDWIENTICSIEEIGYHRYGQKDGAEQYPTAQVAHVILVGKFLYEHLLPVPRAILPSGKSP